MREIRPSGSEGGVKFYPSSLPYPGREGALRRPRAPPARNVAHARVRRCESRCGDVLTLNVPPAAARSSVIHDGASIVRGSQEVTLLCGSANSIERVPARMDAIEHCRMIGADLAID